VRKPERGRVHVKNLGIDGRIILNYCYRNCFVWRGVDISGSRQE
jgi:hypothetical protein